MDRESQARNTFKSGVNCSKSVYGAFSDRVTGTPPAPRSIEGKCGAVLAAEMILDQLGGDKDSFDKTFLEDFGSLKCADIRGRKVPCVDLVGAAVRMVEELIK